VRRHALSVPVPTVLNYYVDEELSLSHTLELRVPGDDLNTTWEDLNEKQRTDVVYQVATYIDTLAQMRNNCMVSAGGKMICEPFLLRLSSSSNTSMKLDSELLHPNHSHDYEKIWGAEENRFVFYHADLRPTNIKVKLKDGKIEVTGILDWEVAGFLPRSQLAGALIEKGYKNFAQEWQRWWRAA